MVRLPSLIRLVGTTAMGGLLFLLPLVIVVVILEKALQIMAVLLDPIARVLPVHSLIGLEAPYLFGAILLFLMCLLAGFAARHGMTGRVMRAIETRTVARIPALALLKARADGLLRAESMTDMKPVLARFDDYWQLAFEMDRLDDGRVVLYLPGAPDPWSGSVQVMSRERVTPLDLSIRSAGELMMRLGRGAAEELARTRAEKTDDQ
jgi:uncharacterized membrane protein